MEKKLSPAEVLKLAIGREDVLIFGQCVLKINLASTLVVHRDVKTVYFSEPVTGLPKPVFYRLPKGLL